MWCIQKICSFNILTFAIFAWTIYDFAGALQNDTANAVSDVDAGAGNGTTANCSNTQLSEQSFNMADNDTDENSMELQLNQQLFEFANLFSVVNFSNHNQSNGLHPNQNKFIIHTSFVRNA